MDCLPLLSYNLALTDIVKSNFFFCNCYEIVSSKKHSLSYYNLAITLTMKLLFFIYVDMHDHVQLSNLF